MLIGLVIDLLMVFMKIHNLKTDPEVFAMSFSGIKPWEIRFNDMDFKVGDMLVLEETKHSGEEMKKGALLNTQGGNFPG